MLSWTFPAYPFCSFCTLITYSVGVPVLTLFAHASSVSEFKPTVFSIEIKLIMQLFHDFSTLECTIINFTRVVN